MLFGELADFFLLGLWFRHEEPCSKICLRSALVKATKTSVVLISLVFKEIKTLQEASEGKMYYSIIRTKQLKLYKEKMHAIKFGESKEYHCPRMMAMVLMRTTFI